MKSILPILIIFLTTTSLFAQYPQGYPVIYHGTVAVETDDPELKDLKWHRWTTKNFTILSINEQQGEFLAKNIEQVKTWTMLRWGLPNEQLSVECRILAVPSKELMKKLFRIEETKFEVRQESNKTNLYAAWLLLNDTPAKTLPATITAINLRELSASGKIVDHVWAERGISVLNKTLSQVRGDLSLLAGSINTNGAKFSSQQLFTTSRPDWESMDARDKQVFDLQSAALLLLLRKEFGEAKLHQLLRTNNIEQSLWNLYSFKGFTQFDSSYQRYVNDLSKEIAGNRVPDNYLEIRSVRR